jgi:hypothetical protein
MTFKTPANNTVIQPVAVAMGPKFGSLDNLGRLRTSKHQNIYEADFEYGQQPMRWENYIVSPSSNSTITHAPGSGGCRMRIGTASGDVTIRQTRPYHRYQPGKTMVMSTAMNLGTAQTNQRQRVGFFDDGNGLFLEQGDPVPTTTIVNKTGSLVAGNNFITGIVSTAGLYIGQPVTGNGLIQYATEVDTNGNIVIPSNTVITNIINSTSVAVSTASITTTSSNTYSFTSQANPYGMYCVVRSDVNAPGALAHGVQSGIVTDYRMPSPTWNGDAATIASIDWTRIQMIWMEYTWYGAGMIRWGVVINGEWVVLHYVGFGNKGPVNAGQFPSQQSPWARTGNLPVRYEQRNVGAVAQINDMYHYGVSVVIEGGSDEQRGFTYSYGMSPATPRRTVPASNTRYPIMSVSSRPMGVIELSGNSTSTTTANSQSTNSVLKFTTANLTFDGVLSSSSTATLTNGSNVVLVTSGSTANIIIGQTVTSTTAGVPAGATVSAVNSTAYVLSSSFTGTTTPAATANTYTNNSLVGRHIYFPQQGTIGQSGRITASNSTSITFGDIITGNPIANTATMTGTNFQIGLINRGQLLPKRLMISSDKLCYVEIITSTTSLPITLTGAAFATVANTTNTPTSVGSIAQANIGTLQAGLGSNFSFAQRDVSATAVTGGEVVFGFTLDSGSGLQDIDLSYFFPLYTTIVGATPDVLTVAVTTGTSAANVGVNIIGQEAMS